MKPTRRQPGKARVFLTRVALDNIREIERYWVQQWGRRVARKYVDDIAAALVRLSENPRLLRLDPDVAPGLSFYRARQHHLVCYCRADQILVLTLIHTGMNLPERLAELEPRLAAEVEFLGDRLYDVPE